MGDSNLEKLKVLKIIRTGMGLPLTLRIIAGFIIGILTGLALGPKAAWLGELGRIVIQFIKAVAAPLLFFFILDSVVKTRVQSKQFGRMLIICAINAVAALILGLGVSNLFRPGDGLKELVQPAAEELHFRSHDLNLIGTLERYIPANLIQPFHDNQIVTLILLSLLIGFAVRAVKKEGVAVESFSQGVSTILEVFEKVLSWVLHLVPLAVFGVVAKAVGVHGFAMLHGLGKYVAVGLLGLSLHIVLVYQVWLRFFLKKSLKFFWKHARAPVVYAFGCNSSLATLPVTLKSLEDMKVSRSAATLGACVGTNLNNDGIILYEAMAALVVAQAHGISLGTFEQVMIAGVCVVASIGVAGVPEAGFISLTLVLSAAGLPQELLPILLSVDWILARARSVTNVLGDIVVSSVLDRWKSDEVGSA